MYVTTIATITNAMAAPSTDSKGNKVKHSGNIQGIC